MTNIKKALERMSSVPLFLLGVGAGVSLRQEQYLTSFLLALAVPLYLKLMSLFSDVEICFFRKRLFTIRKWKGAR